LIAGTVCDTSHNSVPGRLMWCIWTVHFDSSHWDFTIYFSHSFKWPKCQV